MIKHSQYFTSETVASLLIKCISKEDVKTILDLGAGEGMLTKAALKKWRNARCVVADIDESNHLNLLEQGFESRNIDCITSDLDLELGLSYNSIDVGVCNPPYETIEKNQFIEEVFAKAHLEFNRDEKITTSDLVFLAYNLLFLKPHGVLGIIVPYSIMTGRNYETVRQSLLNNYYIERAVELPEKSFSYTEAKTGLLIIRKESSRGRKTKLNVVKEGLKLSDSLYVSQSQLAIRLDNSYHLWRKSQKGKVCKCIDVSIVRGRNTHDDLKKRGAPFFHSTSFNKKDLDWHYKYDDSEKGIIKEGSFLIVRVGKRCVGRVKYLEEGHIQISDCIYGITVPKAFIEEFKLFFLSKEYTDFIKTVARGVCSLYLCKGDLETMILKKLDEFRQKELCIKN